MANRICIDVEDLFRYSKLGQRPSGIQRLEFELCRALYVLPQSKGRVFFVRHDVARQELVAIPREAVETTYTFMTSRSAAELKAASLAARARSALEEVTRVLAPELRKAVLPQIEVLVRLGRSIGARAAQTARLLKRHWRSRSGAGYHRLTDHFATAAEPGDVLAVFGAAWVVSGFTSCVERATREKDLRLAVLIYDVIPLRRPEWFRERPASALRTWLGHILPLADMILTISAATARDVASYAHSAELVLRAVPTPIPIGTGFKKNEAGGQAGHELSSRRPPANSYALVVSTLEVRKNHLLLFRVWRRLLDDMPAESVPTLVFAGQVGWLVGDLMERLDRARFLDGKIIHIDSPTDQELEALYDGCLFTLFPSLYEGWGLPVTESCAFGRPCLICDSSSLPEAGGSLARYIDAESTTDAYRVIRETIEDRAGLRAWRDRVRREFQPVEGSESAGAVLKVLDATKDAPTAAEPELRRCA